ncbi:HAD family hydrolase [Kitasatospora purpeofusca]|uniref:HAD family hydrolase n=1 Tax=Kitasatospora purpeofusca TaxID=67352 RepID=UPI0038658076
MSAIQQQLAEVLKPVKHVLLDFDGPVCSVFAGLPAADVAHRLREGLLASGAVLSDKGEAETDPLALLRLVSDSQPIFTEAADAALTILEISAVQMGQPNTGGELVLQACDRSGRSVSIVSNNSGKAIESYLSGRGLQKHVAGVFGRIPGCPSLMKPNPRLLFDAMRSTRINREHCIFIGDAARDVEAGTAAGIPTIGYANKPGKMERLSRAGALLVVDSMQEVADTLDRIGRVAN